MNDAAIVAAWAAVIAALLGPVVSVAIAHWMVRQENKRREAAELFRRIMENAQNYRHSFLDQHRFRTRNLTYADKLNKLLAIIRETASADDAEGKRIHAETNALYQHGASDQQAIQDEYTRAFQETRAIESLLNADKLSLGLLFDQQSKPCGLLINELIEMSEDFNRDTIPEFVNCQERLNILVYRIGQEFKPLYESLRQADSFADV